MKKRYLLFTILFVALIMFGCADMQIKETSTHRAIAYSAGRAMAIGIYKIDPLIDQDLTSAWVEMMERNEGKLEISSEEVMMFYNKCIMLMTRFTNDPYGLLGDLGYFLTIFGAEFAEDTKMMVAIQPVPMVIMKDFENGYDYSRMLIRKE